MNQDWRISSFHVGRVLVTLPYGEDIEVVVVVAGDGQVPHPAVVLLRSAAADYYHNLAVRSLETLIFR